jgi:pimeloyl-ACP methyl ester carboxylesterase
VAEGERHRLRRILFWVLVVAVVFHIAGGWYFSGVLEDRALSAEARRASNDLDPDLVVESIDGATIVLAPDGEGPSALDEPGLYGLRWEGGNGTIGPIIAEDDGTVSREFALLGGTAPEAGTRAELDVRVFTDPAEAGVDVEDVVIEGPLGDYPAWSVPAEGETTVIVVHGNSLSRLDNVRWLPALREAGFPTLTVTYRNDAEAPPDPSGLLRYGLTEWADLEAAVRYALDQGSDDVVLFGDSMGGGVIAAFMQRSALASRVRVLVLDAPMLDFDQTVSDNAAREPLVGPIDVPPTLTWSAKRIADLRYDVDWPALRYVEDPRTLGIVPTLIVHGTDDLTVPIATSREAAARYPATVTLAECEGADHIECWNRDPEGMETLVTAFLEGQVAASQG